MAVSGRQWPSVRFVVLCELSGDSTSRLIPLTRGIQQLTCGTFIKYLVGATDLSSRPTNMVSLSIVLWSLTRH